VNGRELDAEVARRVFGLEGEERANKRTGELDFVHRISGSDSWLRVPEYSQTLTASITLENELATRGESMVRRVYGYLGQVRHRAEVVEYRVEQHTAAWARASPRSRGRSDRGKARKDSVWASRPVQG
jgi:hypothetical protein